MSYIIKINNSNVNDYVIDASKIPAIEKNRDYTQVLAEIDLTVSGKVPLSSVQPGNEITIAPAGSSSYPFYIGVISENKYDYAQRAHRLQIRSKLAILNEFSITYTTLHGALVAGANQQQYRAVDNGGYPSTQILWILERMFAQVDIEVSLPNPLGEIIRFNFGASERVIQFQHLRIDENMLYAINQQVAVNHTIIESDYEKLLLVPTFWDFFVWVMSSIGNTTTNLIGYNMRWSTSGTPEKLIISGKSDTVVTSISDDTTYDKEDSNIIGDSGGYAYDVLFSPDRSKYAGTSNQSLVSHQEYSGRGKNSLNYPSNFIIMYEKYWVAAGDVFGLADYPLYVYPANNFLKNQRRTIGENLSIEKFVTDSTIITKVKENYIDLARREAEIIQEV